MPCTWANGITHARTRFADALQRSKRYTPTTQHQRRTLQTLNSTPHQPPPLSLFADTQLTSSAKSRAAANSVRFCLSNRDAKDGFFIINSLRCSQYLASPDSPLFRAQGLNQELKDFEPQAMKFGEAVSPRQACHAMLHGLVRMGSSARALRISQFMMEDGIPIRARTLESIIQSLQTTPTVPLAAQARLTLERFFGKEAALAVNSHRTHTEATRYAVDMIVAARGNRKEQDPLFNTVLKLHGNIILASLFFVAATKLVARAAPAHEATPVPTSPQAPPPSPSHTSLAMREMVFPSREVLRSMYTALLTGVKAGLKEENNFPALQALSNLASMLHLQQLPFADLSDLVELLSQTSKAKGNPQVWFMDGRHTRCIESGNHIDTLLSELCHRPPSALDRTTYNKLLDFAVRHHQASTLVGLILNRMNDPKRPELHPNDQTLSILASAWPKPRHNSSIAHTMQESRPSNINTLSERTVMPTESPFERLNAKLKSEFNPSSLPLGQVQPNNETYAALALHFTATGEPDKVVDLVYKLIPELSKPVGIESKEECAARAEACRDRVTALGPYVLSTLLNGLRKAKRLGLLTLLWRVCREAEAHSWNDEGTGSRPWFMPIAAYTTMVQAYAAEAGLWHKTGPNQYVTTWGGSQNRGKPRAEVGYRFGWTIYRDLFRGAESLAQRIEQDGYPEGVGGLRYPRPDARFFNAALELVDCGRRRRRTKHKTKAKYMQRLQTATDRWMEDESATTRIRNPHLLQVMKDMSGAGHAIPVGYWQMLIGEYSVDQMSKGTVWPVDRQPTAFPEQRQALRSRTHALVEQKTRGLPIRKEKKAKKKYE